MQRKQKYAYDSGSSVAGKRGSTSDRAVEENHAESEDNEPDIDAVKASWARPRWHYLLWALSLLLGGYQVGVLVLRLFPEFHMVIHSQCRIKTRGWNGQILGLRIGTNTVDSTHRPPSHNIHNRRDADGDRRVLSASASASAILKEDVLVTLVNDIGTHTTAQQQQQQPHYVIMWGTHHRTGSHFATKLFASLCAKYHWCCVFHPTRDSIEAIQFALQEEDVHVFGHNQFVWEPNELFLTSEGENKVKYRFIHFYRDPVKKILSGYRYHFAGGEAWTKKVLHFSELCGANMTALSGGDRMIKEVNRGQVFDYCHNVHLCETCCRKAHERLPIGLIGKNKVRSNYITQNSQVYDYICANLGQIQGTTYQQALLDATVEDGLAVEAAVEFFENQRMVAIVDKTWNDPYTLNVDIDELKRDFRTTVQAILQHLNLDITEEENDELVVELDVFNLSQSFSLYSWTQNNIFNRHVTEYPDNNDNNNNNKRSSKEKDILSSPSQADVLLESVGFLDLYSPMLEKLKNLK